MKNANESKPKTEIAYSVFGRDNRITWKRKIVLTSKLEAELGKLSERGAIEIQTREAQ